MYRLKITFLNIVTWLVDLLKLLVLGSSDAKLIKHVYWLTIEALIALLNWLTSSRIEILVWARTTPILVLVELRTNFRVHRVFVPLAAELAILDIL